jgi:ribosomal protein S10
LRLFLIKFKSLLSLVGEISVVVLPKHIKKITLLRSTHINKKSKEQFESCKISLLIKVKAPLAKTFLFKELIHNLLNQKPSVISFKVQQFVALDDN